jgi:hypothetical protein
MPPMMRRRFARQRLPLTEPPPPVATPARLAAVFAPDGELVSPWGIASGHDAFVKVLASYMKPGDKDEDTLTSARMSGDVALCTGGYAFTPADSASDQKGFWTKIVGKVGDDWKILNLTYTIEAPQ